MKQYFLAPKVFYCHRGSSVVFLDLVHDDYSLASGEAAAWLATLSGLQARQEDCSSSHSRAGIDELLRHGLLVEDATLGKPIAATAVEVALEQLVDPMEATEAHPRLSHVWNFLVACTVAAIRLRFMSIDRTVASVRRRRVGDAIDVHRARELTAVFRRLRALFPRSYLCLYDSLALLEFLAKYKTFPTWVFGISLEPWAAHCWVQAEGLVFDEGVEEAASYTPIMCV